MKSKLIAALALGMFANDIAAQSTTSAAPVPERLMIGPTDYVRAPNPFPFSVPANASSLEVTRARNTAPRIWGMSNALPCRPVATVDTAGWTPIQIGTQIGNAALPAQFKQDTTFRSYHGGLKWSAGDVGLQVENGWWGVAYDSAGYLTACRVTVRDGEYLVNEVRTSTGYAFHAFPLDPTWRPSTMITGSANSEEGLRIAWTGFLSMVPPRCRYMTGAPLRNPSAPAC